MRLHRVGQSARAGALTSQPPDQSSPDSLTNTLAGYTSHLTCTDDIATRSSTLRRATTARVEVGLRVDALSHTSRPNGQCPMLQPSGSSGPHLKDTDLTRHGALGV